MTRLNYSFVSGLVVRGVAKANKDLDNYFRYNSQFISITAADVYFISRTADNHGDNEGVSLALLLFV